MVLKAVATPSCWATRWASSEYHYGQQENALQHRGVHTTPICTVDLRFMVLEEVATPSCWATRRASSGYHYGEQENTLQHRGVHSTPVCTVDLRSMVLKESPHPVAGSLVGLHLRIIMVSRKMLCNTGVSTLPQYVL
jgi:hypothetical protein